MADKIQIYAGNKAKLPTLLARELGYCKDTQELYIGTSDGNALIGAVVWGTDITSLKSKYSELDGNVNTLTTDIGELSEAVNGKLTASKALSVDVLANEATTTDIVTAFNTLISSLKAAGIME